jgi:hypothetical protein
MTRPGLFSALVKYAPQAARSAEENFSTELLAFCLRSVLAFRRTFLRFLLKDLPSQSIDDDRWEVFTQRPIALGPKARKYPDLYLEGPDELVLLLEVKVESPVTLSAADDGIYVPQLELYRKWLEGRDCAGRGMLFVLSKYVCDGAENCTGHVRWGDVHRLVVSTMTELSPGRDVDRFILHEFARFLKEQGMIPEAITSDSLKIIEGFRSLNRTLWGMVGNLNARWQSKHHLKASSGKMSESAEGYIIGAPCSAARLQLRLGLWFDADGIVPLVVVKFDELAPQAREKLLGHVDRYGAQRGIWWGHSYALYGKAPAGFLEMTADDQEEAIAKEGDAILKDVLKIQ